MAGRARHHVRALLAALDQPAAQGPRSPAGRVGGSPPSHLAVTIGQTLA
ncbi:hypothetical protein [Streptomyces sp. NPDC101237]